jgi:hypothetical protein
LVSISDVLFRIDTDCRKFKGEIILVIVKFQDFHIVEVIWFVEDLKIADQQLWEPAIKFVGF